MKTIGMNSSSVEVLSELYKKLEQYTKNPVDFLSPQENLSEDLKLLIKQLYDSSKYKKASQSLPELIVGNFDEEQIWQELELRNEERIPCYVADVAGLLSRKGSLICSLKSVCPIKEPECISQATNSIELGKSDDGSEGESHGGSIEGSDANEDSFSENPVVAAQDGISYSSKKKSIVDDAFFKLHELETFLNKEEMENKSDEESYDEIDYFEGESEVIEEEKSSELNPSYKEFFPPPLSDSLEDKKSDSNNKITTVRRALQAMAGENDKKRSLENEMEEKSMFEERQERLLKKIKQLESSNVAEKPWQLKGEVTAVARPPNSLLEEVLEVDISSRPAPIITEKTTLKLEDIIRQRIKDNAWDDVEKKFKPIDTPSEFKKRIVLSQEKSKMSLAEVYEQEYLKKKKESENNMEEQEKELEEHQAIKKMMSSLFSKLDALSNFHYTPKPIAPDIQIISHVPAIQMEEVAPVATSEAKLLAPEEVKAKPKGDTIGKDERTDTDKKRERRKKKLRQRERRLVRERRDKVVGKLNPGLGNKYSKEKAIRMLEKVTKEDNVDLMVNNHKTVKSSKAFFTQLQDEVANHVKANVIGSKKKEKHKISAHKIKL